MRRKTWQAITCIAMAVCFGSPSFAEQLETFTEPYKSVSVPAPEIGIISEILVKEGDEVLETQVLARLDDEVLQASLKVARAAKDALGARNTAETELLMRKKQLESYRNLHEQGNATQRELDRAESEYEQAVSRLQTVREELDVRRLEYERVKAQIKQRVLKSTIDGHVVTIEKEVGEFVSPTDPIVMHIVHLKTLKAVFWVPTDAAKKIRPGQLVTLRIGYDQGHCKGVVEFVSPVAKAESNTVRVKIRIPNQQRKVPSGVVCHWNLQVEDPAERTTDASSENTSVR